MSWGEGEAPKDLGHAEVRRETDAAIEVACEGWLFWVPKSVIHDDSEVWELDQEGQLIVKQWWADKGDVHKRPVPSDEWEAF